MFLTHPDHEQWMPRFAGFENHKAWKVMELLSTPCFLLHVDVRSEPMAHAATYMIGAARDLASSIASLPTDVAVRAVHVVAPSSHTGANSWQMFEVREMWQVSYAMHSNDRTRQETYSFENGSGEIFLDGFPQDERQHLSKEKLIYRRAAPPQPGAKRSKRSLAAQSKPKRRDERRNVQATRHC